VLHPKVKITLSGTQASLPQQDYTTILRAYSVRSIRTSMEYIRTQDGSLDRL